MSSGVELTVQGAEKRDAGRGIARLSASTLRELGVLSGETLLLDGPRGTVAKVWPGGEDGTVRIDADTRRNAGLTVGDAVTVRPIDVDDARQVVVALADPSGSGSEEDVAELVARDLLDRPVGAGETVTFADGSPGTVRSTRPEGTVRVTDDTRIEVVEDRTSGPAGGRPGPAGKESKGEAGGESGPKSPVDEGSSADAQPAPAVTYEDIGGLDDELEQVREMIELPMRHPELFQQLGIEPPKGVLLHGPPGTGKTLMAQAVANEIDAYFTDISGPEIMSKYYGESEEQLREMFDEAEENEPAIVFIDELDSIAPKRDETSGDVERRVVAQLLSLMDGLEERGQVTVIAATNRVDAIDPALRRGGRFDREIEIGVPSEQGRREILDVHTRDMPLAEDADLDSLAARLHGFVGADIASLAREAGMAALRRRERPAETAETDETLALSVTQADFTRAMKGIEPSGMREYVAESPTTDFTDVGGLDDTKDRLREAIEWPLAYEPLFEAAATDPPSGVLLHGPPGTGKTLLAEAIAGESGVNFVRVAGPEVLDRYVGESEQAIRDLFERARQTAPAIVFLDEVDAIASERGEGHEVTERVVSQLLTELDRAADHPTLVVLAATNRKEDIDPALLRPGRFEQHIEVPNPDESARREVLEVHTEGTPLGEAVDLDELAAETADYSGAELEALVREASMRAIREIAAKVDPEEARERADEVTVDSQHFGAARDALDRRRSAADDTDVSPPELAEELLDAVETEE